MSKVASGFPDHVRNDDLLLGVHLDVLLDHPFHYHHGPRHGLSSATSDHMSSSFRPKAFSRRVILVVLLKHGYLFLCTSQLSSICSGVLHFNSTSSLVHFRKIVAFLFAFSLLSGWDPMSGLQNVSLSLSSVLMCVTELPSGRCLTQNFLRLNRRAPFFISSFTVLSTGSAPVWDSVSHFASFGFGPSPAVTSQLKAARGKQPELWQPFGG